MRSKFTKLDYDYLQNPYKLLWHPMMKGKMSLLMLGAGWRYPLALLLLKIGLKDRAITHERKAKGKLVGWKMKNKTI